MNSKIILLSIAVVSVGLFALPNTMSLFSGQHTFTMGENIQCNKCHQDIYDEMTSTANEAHTSSVFTSCERCHRTAGWGEGGANITTNTWRTYKWNPSSPYTQNYSDESQFTAENYSLNKVLNLTAHAAVTVECLACHGTGNTKWNSTKSISGVAQEIQGSSEAHRNFYYESVSDVDVGDINQTSLGTAGIRTGPTWYTVTSPSNQSVIKLKGTNAACIGCHTHAVVNITWTRALGYNVTVDMTTGASIVNFTGTFGSNETTTSNH